MKTRQSMGIIITIILVGLCLTFSGCSSDSDSDTTPIETVLVQSGKERNTSPERYQRKTCLLWSKEIPPLPLIYTAS